MQVTAFIQRFRSEIFQHERNIFQITIIRTDNETQSAWQLPRLCKRATDRVCACFPLKKRIFYFTASAVYFDFFFRYYLLLTNCFLE